MRLQDLKSRITACEKILNVELELMDIGLGSRKILAALKKNIRYYRRRIKNGEYKGGGSMIV